MIAQLLFFNSCKEEEVQSPYIDTWHFQKIIQSDVQDPAEFEIHHYLNIYLSLDPDGKCTVTSYCNTGTGIYTMNGGLFELLQLAMTEKHCQVDEPLAWESIFIYNLELADSYWIEGSDLIIYSEGDYDLSFIRK